MFVGKVAATLYQEASGAFALLKLIFQLFLVSHFVACIWFRVAVTKWMTSRFDPEENWAEAQDLFPRVDGNWAYEYVTSVYWVSQNTPNPEPSTLNPNSLKPRRRSTRSAQAHQEHSQKVDAHPALATVCGK